MNDREKKLIYILFGAAFIIVNVFLFTSYKATMDKKRASLVSGEKQIRQMLDDINQADSQQEEMEWLKENEPAEGIHSQVRSDLVSAVQKSARKYGVAPKKAPIPQPENTNEFGAFRSATVKAIASARDRELYLWLTDLQDPKSCRSVTFLRISPQRDDRTRVDCELEVTQWFTPKVEDETIPTE